MIRSLVFPLVLCMGFLSQATPLAAAQLNEKAAARRTLLPATKGVYATETVTLKFRDLADLKSRMASPIEVDLKLIDQVAAKCEQLIGKSIYPSELAHLMFELCFTDPIVTRLNEKMRQEHLGYLMSNLGAGNALFTQQLFAFYYGYSFQHFAPARPL